MKPDGYLIQHRDELEPADIISEVARGFKLTFSDIVGSSRQRHITVARACAMAVIREATSLSYPAIGEIFERDHTTVMWNVQRVMSDPELSRAVHLVVEELSPPPRLFSVEVVPAPGEAG